MADDYDGKVHVDLAGQKTVMVHSEYGKLRISGAPDLSAIGVCIVDAPKENCRVEISYGKTYPGLSANGHNVIDFDALGPKLLDTIKGAFAGTEITASQANEIGRRASEINTLSIRQTGAPLR